MPNRVRRAQDFFAGTPLGDLSPNPVNRTLPQRHASSESLSQVTEDNSSLRSHSPRPDAALDDDPKQWQPAKKLRVIAIISFYTFAVYAGSAIYIASVPGVMHEYKASEQTALLGLSLYVAGYGIGPLIWAPLSEVAWIGRNPVYWITALVFLIVSVITATAQSWSLFLTFRFIQGFFGSPCLANGGASLHDIFEGRYLPLSLAVWVAFAYAGPAIGPVMASYLVESSGWRISMWEIVACAAIALIMLLILPETYMPKVQHKKQKQIRDKDHAENPTERSVLHTLRDALVKPIQIMCQDPAIAYVNIYTSYLYSCYYTFFDGFPLVYTYTYNFAHSHVGLTFLPIIIGCGVAAIIYTIYIMCFTISDGERNPEARLVPALLAVFAPPIGILIFGWTAERGPHWIWGMIGVVIYAAGVFIILQCIIMYILDSYPRYAASLFAANDFSRSSLAAGAVHFGLPLYINMGSGKACTILGSVSILGIVGMYGLYWYGARLRARSRFTG